MIDKLQLLANSLGLSDTFSLRRGFAIPRPIHHSLALSAMHATLIKRNAQRGPRLQIRQDWQAALAQSRLTTFDTLWEQPRTWVEPANKRRGGWSGVSKLNLPDGRTLFFKRQERQQRRTLRRPFGYPTYSHEQAAYQIVNELMNITDTTVFYGERRHNGTVQSMIATESLEDDWIDLYKVKKLHADSPRSFNNALRKLGQRLAQMHRLGIQHGALFHPHVWFQPESDDIRLIDWEGCRFRFSPTQAAVSDFRQFLKRTTWLEPDQLNELLFDYNDKLARAGNLIRREYQRIQKRKSAAG